MNSKSTNTEIIINNNKNENINELFESLFTIYKLDLGNSVKSSNFDFANIDRKHIYVIKLN